MSSRSHINRWPALYALAYFITAVLLATLAPFDFHWLAAGSSPAWLVDRADVLQNILLFVPIGLVLSQIRRPSLWYTVALGFLLSSSVEFAQLSLVGRSSNYVDIITNTTGAFAGWVFGAMLRRVGVLNPVALIYSLMVLPLCWVIALRSLHEKELFWLVVPAAIVSLTSCKAAMKPHLLRWPLLAIWLGMALLPMFYVSRHADISQFIGGEFLPSFICSALVGVAVFLTPDDRLGPKIQAGLLMVVLAALIFIDASWFYAQGSGLTWTAHVHLHWVGVVICLSLLFYFLIWLAPWWKR